MTSGATVIFRRWPGKHRGPTPIAGRRHRSWTVAALVGLLLAAGSMVGCRGAGSGEAWDGTVRIESVPTPPVAGATVLVIELHDPEGEPVEGARVELIGTMDHAGMPPVRAVADEESEGRYRVPVFRFTMAGDWILSVLITPPGGPQAEHRTRVRVVGPPEGTDP